MTLPPTRSPLLPTLLLALLLTALAAPAAADFTATAVAPLAGDVAVGALPAVAGGFDWTHGTGTTLDVGQTFLAPADFALGAVTVRVAAEDGVAGREVSLHVTELGPGGDPATGTPIAATAADLPIALSPGVTLYVTLRLPTPVDLQAGRRYAFRLHIEGGGGVNLARASVLHGGDAYPDGTAFEMEGGFTRLLPADLLFLVHGAAELPCVGNGTTLCLRENRFAVTATFSTDGVLYQAAHAVPLTTDTGWFWFFRDTNVELVTKVLDGCPVNAHYWVFTAGLTDVEVLLQATDLGVDPPQAHGYHNPNHRPFPPILDAAAFATCP